MLKDERMYTNSMAQVLKQEYRELILKSALDEFFLHGFNDASMRKISQNANMTVGNLYHYYKDKEDLFSALVSDTVYALNQTIIPLIEFPIEVDAYLLANRNEYFHSQIKLMSKDLVKIFLKRKKELLILFRYSKINNQIIEWINKLISHIIKRWFPNVGVDDQKSILLCDMLANSLFAGISQSFEKAQELGDDENLKWVLENYLNLFIQLLKVGDEYYNIKK